MWISSGRIDAYFVGTEKSTSVRKNPRRRLILTTRTFYPSHDVVSEKVLSDFSVCSGRTFRRDQRGPPISVPLPANFEAHSTAICI